MFFIKLIIKLPYILYFIVFYVCEIIFSNFLVAIQILKPNDTLKPGIVAVPLEMENDHGINLMANLITMTPGTLSVDVSDDKKFLYIHVLHVENVDNFKKNIKNKFENRVSKLVS